MSDEIEVLVELLTDVLGKPHHHYGSKGQISFDCPVCSDEKGLDHGDGKGNLEINYSKHVYNNDINLRKHDSNYIKHKTCM